MELRGSYLRPQCQRLRFTSARDFLEKAPPTVSFCDLGEVLDIGKGQWVFLEYSLSMFFKKDNSSFSPTL